MTCPVDGCGRSLVCREPPLCAKHYRRWRKHGDPATVMPPGAPRRPLALCRFPGCKQLEKLGARGWCGKHHARWYRHGDPSVDGNKQRQRRDVVERIRERLAVEGDCWIWLGSRLPRGYGYIGVGNQHRYVHRVMWETQHGALDAGLQLHHECARRACCNPAHLRPVTPAEHARLHR